MFGGSSKFDQVWASSIIPVAPSSIIPVAPKVLIPVAPSSIIPVAPKVLIPVAPKVLIPSTEAIMDAEIADLFEEPCLDHSYHGVCKTVHKACAKAKSKGKGKGTKSKGKGKSKAKSKGKGKGAKASAKNTRIKNESSKAYHGARKEAFASGLDLEQASALGRKASAGIRALLSA